MLRIHPRFCVFVAIDAREGGIVWLRYMAIGASFPYAGAMYIAGMDGEIRVRKESRRLPSQSSMADRTFGVEPGCDVVWILCCIVLVQVARDAFTRCATVSIPDMTAQASNCIVRTACWELSQIMVEGGLP
jgi:hypothetical protein